MTNNIVEVIQKRLGYPPLKKVDPNNQEPAGTQQSSVEEKLAQSAIPVVLAGFFRLSRTDEGCNIILNSKRELSWLQSLFGDQESLAVEKVAQYAHVSTDEARIDMEQAAREAYKLLIEAAGDKHPIERVRSYMSNQRHAILVYLPPVMQLGYLLNDNAMDDRTNKMEGPVSDFMHTIENKFSGGGN